MTYNDIIRMAMEADREWDLDYADKIMFEWLEEFATLVAKHEREACAKPRDSCNSHPKVPHGFSRNASHTEDRYVCECEHWNAGYQQGMIDTLLREQVMTSIKRFTVYRRKANTLTTHNADQKNPENEPQFEGVIWTDGSVTLRWLTACRSTSVWQNIEDCLAIHGHPEYGTEIDWHDGEAPQVWIDQCADAIRTRGEINAT